MRKYLYFNFILYLGIVTLITACNPKQTVLENLQSFTENLERNSGSYTPEKWKSSIAEYDEISKNLATYESEFTPDEKERIGRLKGRCQVIFFKHALEDGINEFDKELSHYKGLFEGIMDELLNK